MKNKRNLFLTFTLIFGTNLVVPFFVQAQSENANIVQLINADILSIDQTPTNIVFEPLDIQEPVNYESYYVNPHNTDPGTESYIKMSDGRFSGNFVLQVELDTPDFVRSGGSETIDGQYLSIVTEQEKTYLENNPAPPSAFSGVSGPPIGLQSDQATFEQALPFEFTFFGKSYNTVTICTNGFINLGSDTSCPEPSDFTSPDEIMTASTGPARIIPYFKNLDTTLGDVYVNVTPADVVIRWDAYLPSPGSEQVQFEVQLTDNNNQDEISFRYANNGASFDPDSSTAIVGLTTSDGTHYQYSNLDDETVEDKTADFTANPLNFEIITGPNVTPVFAYRNGNPNIGSSDYDNPLALMGQISGTNVPVDILGGTVCDTGRFGTYTLYPSYRIKLPPPHTNFPSGTYEGTIVYTLSDSTLSC